MLFIPNLVDRIDVRLRDLNAQIVKLESGRATLRSADAADRVERQRDRSGIRRGVQLDAEAAPTA